VSPTEFVFAMRVAGRDRLAGMLGEVAETVFRHLGLSAAAVTDLTARLNAVISTQGSADADLDLQFTASAESCEVMMSSGEREIWREEIRTS
jgi:hypothetical protein